MTYRHPAAVDADGANQTPRIPHSEFRETWSGWPVQETGAIASSVHGPPPPIGRAETAGDWPNLQAPHPIGMDLFQRKYQPRTFAQLIGQPQIAAMLRRFVQDGEHGPILLAGPSGSGKTTTALILAKALNCRDVADGEPCNACPSCQAMDHPDGHDAFIALNGASSEAHKTELEYLFREHLAFAPLQGPRPVVFIDEAHQLSRSARDYLLTILPDARSPTIVLAMIDDSHLPPQFANRLSRFLLAAPTMQDRLRYISQICEGEGIAADTEALELVAERSTDFRHAEGQLTQILRKLGGAGINVAAVCATIIRPRSQPYENYVLALGRGALQDQLSAFTAFPDAPAIKIDRILDLLVHLKTCYIGPALLAPSREAALAFDPATCREIVEQLATIAYRFGQSVAELMDGLLEYWSFQPLRISDEVARAAVVRCHDLLAAPRDAKAPPIEPSALSFSSSRALRRPHVRRRLAQAGNPGTFLTATQAFDIYEAATFLTQEYGAEFNARLALRFDALGIVNEAEAAATLSDLSRNLAQRFENWGFSLHRIGLLESEKGNLRGRFVFHLPEEIRPQARAWLERYIAHRSQAGGASDLVFDFAGKRETQRKRRAAQHWSFVHELWAGVDPSLMVAGVPLVERLGVPDRMRRPSGMITGRRLSFSQSIGQHGQTRAREAGMAHVSAVAVEAWSQISTGWEFLEHRERDAERSRRQAQISALEERLACTGDPLAHAALVRQLQAERRSWTIEARHRPRQHSSWITNPLTYQE